MPKIRELIDMLKFQNWEHLFEFGESYLHEEEVKMFYLNLEIFDDGLYLTFQVNGMDMGLDDETLSEILVFQLKESGL